MMATHVFPDLKNQFEFYLMKGVDLLWVSAVISTLGFGIGLLVILTIGVAIDFDIIKVPPQFCHYMAGNQHMYSWCK
jgi:hypothetical protein